MRIVWDWFVKKGMDYVWMFTAPLASSIAVDLFNYWGPARTAGICVCVSLAVFSTLMFLRQERKRDRQNEVDGGDA